MYSNILEIQNKHNIIHSIKHMESTSCQSLRLICCMSYIIWVAQTETSYCPSPHVNLFTIAHIGTDTKPLIKKQISIDLTSPIFDKGRLSKPYTFP